MSFITPFIPAIAGGIASIFSRGGGSAARKDYSRLTGAQDTMQQLSDYTTSLGKTQAQAGTGTTATGLQTLAQPKDYWSRILSGSRPAQMAAVAPEMTSINEAAAAQRAIEGAYGTSRGGGTNIARQDAETQRMTDINRALFAARQPAAEGLTGIGQTEASIGLQQMSNALRSIGLSESAINSILSSAQQSRVTSAGINQNTMSEIGKVIASIPFNKIFKPTEASDTEG